MDEINKRKRNKNKNEREDKRYKIKERRKARRGIKRKTTLAGKIRLARGGRGDGSCRGKKGSAVFPRRPLVNYVFVEPIESHCTALRKGDTKETSRPQ